MANTRPHQDRCTCFPQYRGSNPRSVRLHSEQQDTSSPGWRHLLALIDEAAADGRELFHPLPELSPEERRQIVTLPPTIAKLTAVKHLSVYGSNLVRIPPEIGAMTSLEEFTPYTSRRLHWFPYELTRCPNLIGSTVSTRSLYGNEKYRPPFPQLPHSAQEAPTPHTCSVCDQPLAGTEIHQAWISLVVATDVLPLLVNACSHACLQTLPAPPEGYVQTPHTGGPGLTQPSSR
ncbi:hypothetical protein [Streptomyces sp. NRRL WC-3742]|uniref:hypothetical protein n=1 Tax=Streptomyces sp. NRRL WC-3742 TaxID=1463934 RepID=UPI0004C5483E|nr:hypothetical protein [Streptomyces sp. NRRL WC-3742]